MSLNLASFAAASFSVGLGELAAVQSLPSDLSALASVRAADERGVAFALVLPLHEKESLQES